MKLANSWLVRFKSHKKVYIFFLLLILIIASLIYHFASPKSSSDTSYQTATVQKTDISKTISVSGNIEAAKIQELGFKVTSNSTISEILVKAGDKVTIGQELAKINKDTDLENELIKAQSSLLISQNNLNNTYEKNRISENELSTEKQKVTDAQLKLEQANKDLEAAQINQEYSIESLEMAVEKAERELAQAKAARDNSEDNNDLEEEYGKDKLEEAVEDAEDDLNQAKNDLKAAKASGASQNEIDQFEEAVTSAENKLQQAENSLDLYEVTENNNELSLDNSERSVESAEDNLKTAKANLEKAKQLDAKGLNDIASLQQNVKTAESQLLQAQNAYNDFLNEKGYTKYDIANMNEQIKLANLEYQTTKKEVEGTTMKAEFDGQIATVNMKLGTNPQDGTITIYDPTSLYLEITLGEYDVAKLKEGMRANITIDALNDKAYIGEITEISLSPSIESNVVSYSAKIKFLATDDDLKLGYSASATITLEAKEQVLTIPTAAISTKSDENYVKILKNNQIEEKKVEIGMVADTLTEITSGLEEGEEIIVSVITKSSTSSTQTSSALQIPGAGGGMRPEGQAGNFQSRSTSSRN